jgi:hypothetical protein
MRRPLAFLALSVVWAGCFSSGSSGGPQTTFDAGFDAAEFDSSVEDSPVMEAAAEASPEASAPQDSSAPADVSVDTYDAGVPVIVVVQGASGPESGVTVVYADATGNPLGTQTTDATGRASRVVAAGSSLTVLLGDPNVYAAPTTILGVEPGDVLTLVDWGSMPSTPIQVTAQTPFTGAADYLASVTQVAVQSPLPVSLTPAAGPGGFDLGAQGLVLPLSFPLLLDARDTNDDPLGYLYSKASPFPSVSGDATAGTIALGGTWSTTYTTQTVSITNLPDGGEPFGGFQAAMNEAVAGTLTQNPSAGTNAFTTHVGFPDFEQIEVSSSEYYTGAIALATAVATPTADGASTIDLTPLGSIPAITSASIDSSVPAQPSVTWGTSWGSLSAMTGIVVFASWSGGAPDAGASSGMWTIVSPGTSQTTLQAPPLPSAQSAWAPGVGASFVGNNSGNVWGVIGSALPTYAAVRAATSAFRVEGECQNYGPFVPALPAAGTSLAITMSTITGQCS